MTNQHPIQTKTIMNSPDLRAICAELLLFSEEAGEICYNESLWPHCDSDCTLQDRARALLAQAESKGPSLKEQALSYEEKKELADNPNTLVEVLKVLATDKNYYVRRGVADNQNTPVSFLKVLATDKKHYVREGVARNSNTPVETLRVLATDKNWNVRWKVAENPNTPLEALDDN